MMIQDKIRHYKLLDQDYPQRLAEIANPPKQLYVRGSLPDPDRPAIAIVGARAASPYGRKVAWEFARALSEHGIQVISGFARGIDRAAHEGALAGQTATFAVFGNGVDICYPRENIDLLNKVLERGGFISEFPPGTPPRAQHFPSRNRLISALADKILVVEARERSGALITADFGLEQGRDVYAVPGRITDGPSQGCNRLIMQGAAIAVSIEELLKDYRIDNYIYNMGGFGEKNKKVLAGNEEKVYSCIGLEPKHVEEILAECTIKLPELVSILLRMELDNMIREVAKNVYVRV